jgi:hypothetical protein
MAVQSPSKPPFATLSESRPRVTSYDTGYEHSLEHWLEVQKMVQAGDAEPSSVYPFARGAKAS